MWSFYIGRLAGIKIYAHLSFLIFMIIIGLSEAISSGIISSLVTLILFGFAFLFVLLHELGHSLTARHYGVEVREITLWPLGGIANIENIPQDSNIELRIAIAGPLVNFVLALILLPIAVTASMLFKFNFIMYLVFINSILMIFNLIPAFPMDGGRIYRAWKSRQVGYLEATREASQIGTVIAVCMCCIGIIFISPILILIGIFVIIAGKEEKRMIEMQYQDNVYDSNNSPFHFFYHDSNNNNYGRKQQQYHFNMTDFQQELYRMQDALRNFFHRRR